MQGLTTVPRKSGGRPPAAERRRGGGAQVGLGVRARRPRPPAEPILVTKGEAARVLGMSVSHYQRHVQHQIKCVHSGQLTLYDYADLRRWAAEEATIGGRAAIA
jgi:hypothetical protein